MKVNVVSFITSEDDTIDLMAVQLSFWLFFQQQLWVFLSPHD